jgi:hypothetical protein
MGSGFKLDHTYYSNMTNTDLLFEIQVVSKKSSRKTSYELTLILHELELKNCVNS